MDLIIFLTYVAQIAGIATFIAVPFGYNRWWR